MAQAVVEIEVGSCLCQTDSVPDEAFVFQLCFLFSLGQLCTKLEDWKRTGDVFLTVCQSVQRVNQLEQICGHIAIALLSESKDKQTLPFAAFAESGEIRVILYVTDD